MSDGRERTAATRGREDFLAWAAAQPGSAHPVPGYEHALFLQWCSKVLCAGERVADESYDRLPPLPPVPPVAQACDAEAVDPAPVESAEVASDVTTAPEFLGAVDRGELLVAYTDGSGTIAERPCGAGVVVYLGAEVILEASRHLGNGTNNHAELSAIRVALAITDAPGLRDLELVIRSDSEYAIGAVTRASETEAHRPNARLIALVRRAMRGRRVRVEWVKGHAGIEGNERADELAGLARRRVPASAPGASP